MYTTAWWVYVIIFLVDLAVMRILPAMMGVIKNMAAWPARVATVLQLVVYTNILLSHAICPCLFAGVA